jgi:hypothetical protein
MARKAQSFITNLFFIQPEAFKEPISLADLPKDIPTPFKEVIRRHTKAFRSDLPDYLLPSRVI